MSSKWGACFFLSNDRSIAHRSTDITPWLTGHLRGRLHHRILIGIRLFQLPRNILMATSYCLSNILIEVLLIQVLHHQFFDVCGWYHYYHVPTYIIIRSYALGLHHQATYLPHRMRIPNRTPSNTSHTHVCLTGTTYAHTYARVCARIHSWFDSRLTSVLH